MGTEPSVWSGEVIWLDDGRLLKGSSNGLWVVSTTRGFPIRPLKVAGDRAAQMTCFLLRARAAAMWVVAHVVLDGIG